MFLFTKHLFLFAILFSSQVLFSQSFSKLSKPEKCWAFFHPFAALKINKIYKKGFPIYETHKKNGIPDKYESDGKLDAFRHTYFMALFAQKIKARKLKRFGEAHEKGNYLQFLKGEKEQGAMADSISSVMDLFNNQVGIALGRENKKKSLMEVRDEVLFQMLKGKLLYAKRNADGVFLDSNGTIINPDDLKNWKSNKCLIKTNE